MRELDKVQVRRAFARAAARTDGEGGEDGWGGRGMLAGRVAESLVDRLDGVDFSPQRIVEVGCGTGADFAELRRRFPEAQIVGVDFAAAMLQRARTEADDRTRLMLADAECLPLAAGTTDLAWSNLCREWTGDDFLPELARVLRPGGLLLFSTLGRDTLREARAALAAAGMTESVHDFFDMHDIGDALQHGGFAEPVMTAERLTLWYSNATLALREAKDWGWGCALTTRRRTLTGRARWQAALSAYRRPFADRPDGRVAATYEVICGMAWRREKTEPTGEAPITFAARPAAPGGD